MCMSHACHMRVTCMSCACYVHVMCLCCMLSPWHNYNCFQEVQMLKKLLLHNPVSVTKWMEVISWSGKIQKAVCGRDTIEDV